MDKLIEKVEKVARRGEHASNAYVVVSLGGQASDPVSYYHLSAGLSSHMPRLYIHGLTVPFFFISSCRAADAGANTTKRKINAL